MQASTDGTGDGIFTLAAIAVQLDSSLNQGPILAILDIRCGKVIYNQKKPIVLRTAHIDQLDGSFL